MALFLIFSIFLLTFFGGAIFATGIPRYFAASTEMLLILLFVLSVVTSQRKDVPPFWHIIFFFLLIGASSVILNGYGFLRFAFSLRLILRFYIFYWSLILLCPDDDRLKKINTFVVILLFLQLPVVAVKFTTYGIAEKTMGAYTQAGGVTTMLPISFIFYLAGYYFLYRPNFRYILLGIGFVLFSIVGKKRAVAFLYPLQFLAIYYYIYIKGKDVHISKKLGVLLLFITTIVILSGSIFYFNETLNPEGRVGGTVDVGFALDYAKKYTTKVHPYGHTSGRVSTTIRVFESLWKSGFARLLFGFGPGSTASSIIDSPEEREKVQNFFYELGISYGLTTMTRISLEYGLLGAITFSLVVFLLCRICWIYYNCETDPYWKAFGAGTVGFSYSMLFFFFAYSHNAFWGDTMPPLYFYAMAVVNIRLKRIGGSVKTTERFT